MQLFIKLLSQSQSSVKFFLMYVLVFKDISLPNNIYVMIIKRHTSHKSTNPIEIRFRFVY